jgi:hypothetical protein
LSMLNLSHYNLSGTIPIGIVDLIFFHPAWFVIQQSPRRSTSKWYIPKLYSSVTQWQLGPLRRILQSTYYCIVIQIHIY